IGVADEGDVLVGVAVVGRPVARHLDDGLTLPGWPPTAHRTPAAPCTPPPGRWPRRWATGGWSPTPRPGRAEPASARPAGASSPPGHRAAAGPHPADPAPTTASTTSPGFAGNSPSPALHAARRPPSGRRAASRLRPAGDPPGGPPAATPGRATATPALTKGTVMSTTRRPLRAIRSRTPHRQPSGAAP